MNGEPTSSNPQVPVTTLAGISSLSELFPVLPLPGTSDVGGPQSLLFHPRVAEEAERLLNSQDPNLISQLANALAATSTQHIELKEGLSESDPSSFKSAPPLLKGILEVNPHLFSDDQGSCSNLQSSEGIVQDIKSEDFKRESKSRVPHINNVSVIQCGPALAQATHSKKVKEETKESKITVKFNAQNHIETGDYKSDDFKHHHVNKTMKEPVVSLKRLSVDVKGRVREGAHSTPSKRDPDQKGDLKSMGRIPKLSSNSVSTNNRNAHTPRKSGTTRGSRRDGKNNKIEENQSDESESEEEEKKKTKFFKGREKEREDQKKKDKADRKRNRTASDEDDYTPEVETKRRRKAPVTRDSSADEDEGEDEDDEEDDDEYDDDDDDDYDSGGELGGGRKKGGRERKSGKPEPMIKRSVVHIKKAEYNKKRLERKLVPVNEKLSPEEMMETGVYQRFNRTVEKIFDNTEDLDLNAEIEECDDVPQEYLIPKYELAELCSEAAKLKSIGAMPIVPPERLVRLLNILEKNIRDGCRVTPIVDEEDEEEDRLWVELVMERIMRAMDASLTSFYIMTAANMSKRIYLEDVIERCVQFAKFQLSNTIYPTFDPVYSVTGKGDYLTTSKQKRNKHKGGTASRNILSLYNKIHEMVGMLADLLDIQTLTDTTVLQLSTMGVAPFFVENVSELQLSALRLVTKVFAKYNKHRRLLLDDILASIARLPNSKRSLRTYRLNSDENIQMLTALVLQLIQCVVELPEELGRKGKSDNNSGDKDSNSHNSKDSKEAEAKASEVHKVDKDVLVCQRYETAIQTAYSFLSVFLQKTGNKSEEIDYRPLFENFVQDLLVTVNKPEWPASELLLSLLGKLLVQKFSNKNTDMALRVSSLDCLGLVAAKLRHDAVSSELKISTIDGIIKEVKEEESQNGPCVIEEGAVPQENGTSEGSSKKSKKKKGNSSIPKDPDEAGDEEEERTVFLQRVLLDWLAVNSANETPLLHARHFYITQWYRDSYSEILRTKHNPSSPNTKKAASHNKKKRKRRGDDSEESSEESEEELEKKDELDEDTKIEVTRLSERRKKFLLTKVPAFPPASSGVKVQTLQTHIDYENAELITRYLARKRPFSQSFDLYLKQILRVLTESAIAVRTKAMKCLTMVVEGDPNVLNRKDMQMGVHHSFLDHSTSVREAAVDLVGKFVLSRPEVLNNYYEMISARILDTGVSVRKRVIKIMKDICLECPEFPKIPEICVKMIRRVNDEEGIKKLVMEVFVNMWFTPVKERPHLDKEALLLKVNNITEVVVTCKETGLDWFEQLLHSMFRPKEDKDDVTKVNTEPPKTLITACKQIVDCLVKHILVIEENAGEDVVEIKIEDGQEVKAKAPQSVSQRLLACLKTLYLFAKIRPQLMIEHCITLQPYLAIKCQTQGDYTMIGVVARTLELVVPLMEHPSETFLSQLEEDAVKLILQHDRTVITSCLALLGSIVNTVTKNYKLIRDCFNKYYNFILDYKKLHKEFSGNPKLESYKPFFRRALYTVGLLLRHFDMKKEEVRCGLPEDIVIDVFATLLYFMDLADINLQYCTLQSLGSVCIRYYELMMGPDLKDLYNTLLADPGSNTQLRIQTLQNIETYLQEEEIRMIKEDQEWKKQMKSENLKEMCDVQSGMASTIIQIYLKQVMECVVAGNMVVRHSSLRVIQLVLAQGLVHPVQIVPYLVCMSTDVEEAIAHSADKQLQDIEKKYPGFISMKAMQGFRLSYRLHTLIQKDKPTRGFRVKEGEHPGALNGFLYSLMRTTKQHRRAVAISLLKQFDDQARTNLRELLFIADNLAYYPYQVLDEPLFIIHHIDIMISCTGTNLLQSFRENLILPPGVEMRTNPDTGELEYNLDDDDDDDVDSLLARIPEDEEQVETLFECINSAQGCLLLLVLKDYLKEIYGLTDGRITQYSPSDTTKQYEKGASKKHISRFTPKMTIKKLKEEALQEDEAKEGNDEEEDPKKKLTLINEYLDFKALMLKIDPDDEEEDSDGGFPKTRSSNDPNNRDLRNTQQNASEQVELLPGTKDGWKGHPKEEEDEIKVISEQLPPMQTRHTRGSGQQQQQQQQQPQQQQQQQKQTETPIENRSPIKPITIRASQITTPSREKRSHRHRDKDRSHRSSSHKKHKKKKKRKKNSDSEDESEYSDPDFLV